MAESLLSRIVAILEALVEVGEPIGPRELARRAEIDRSAVGRILQQLVGLDVLVATNGKYQPGPRLLALGRTLSTVDTLPTAATSVLASLVDEYDETCYVCALHGRSAVFLYECQSSKPLRYVVDLGRPIPLHGGAAGRAILAGLPEVSARKLLEQRPLQPMTDKTIVDVDALMDLRIGDLECGFSISYGERVEGGVAVAAPFFGSDDQCQGSVVLTAPLTRFAKLDPHLVGSAVQLAADTLSSRLGASLETGDGFDWNR